MAALERFIEAQRSTYGVALAELRSGAKREHWMWFVFPQIAGLGRSPVARHYAIRDLAEARAYVTHPLLGARLREAMAALLEWAGRRTAERMLGEIDAIKLRSSCTLFEAGGGDELCGRCLDAFFGGARDAATLALIGQDLPSAASTSAGLASSLS